MKEGLKLRVILKSPPAGVDYGVQRGHANEYEVMSKQRSGKGNLSFELEVGVRPATKGPGIDFNGPFVQGNAGERFFYIDIGTYAGQADSEYGRRLKIPLRGITKSTVEQAQKKAKLVLETTIAGTGKDGGPSCATPKDFSGWKLR